MLNFFGNDCCREEQREKPCCTWIILIVIFLFCCCGCGDGFNRKRWMVSFDPCCILIAALILGCLGCFRLGGERERCC